MKMSSSITTRDHSTSSSDVIIDTTPLLSSDSQSQSNNDNNPTRHNSIREAARFLRRASTRRIMREPSILVREAAAQRLEERQSNWTYSKPVVILDILWNSVFVTVAIGVLIMSRNEHPAMPLRSWIVGYGLQCAFHIVCVCVEYGRRRRRMRVGFRGVGGSDDNSGGYVSLAHLEDGDGNSVIKHLESGNTMFSFIWWIVGFYWVSADGQALARTSPQLYWLCVIFLGFDVLFVVLCVALACIVGIAVCCCLPCIIAILYAVADQEGASKEDIDQLPKFKFRRIDHNWKLVGNIQGPVGGLMAECGTDIPAEHVLSEEDAECCICLSAYDDGVEIRELPCGHHFHCACVDKWLYINATCPLCKFNILKSSQGSVQDPEVV